jgi:hypothetical protein
MVIATIHTHIITTVIIIIIIIMLSLTIIIGITSSPKSPRSPGRSSTHLLQSTRVRLPDCWRINAVSRICQRDSTGVIHLKDDRSVQQVGISTYHSQAQKHAAMAKVCRAGGGSLART